MTTDMEFILDVLRGSHALEVQVGQPNLWVSGSGFCWFYN